MIYKLASWKSALRKGYFFRTVKDKTKMILRDKMIREEVTMRKANIFRSALAVSMAFTLAAAPMSVMAESMDESEMLDEVLDESFDDALDAPLDNLTSEAYVSESSITFGEGMYKLYGQSGSDLSWLKGADFYAKVVPAEDGADVDMTVGVNDTDLLHVGLSFEESGMLYVDIPELFEYPAAVDCQALAKNFSVVTGTDEETQDSEVSDVITEMIFAYLSSLAADAQELFASIPAETWQEEAANYVMPLLTSIEQSEDTGTMTVGELEAPVNIVTYSISSENMAQMIPTYLSTLSQDPVLETLLTSELMDNVLGMIALFSGSSEMPTGEEILTQIRSALDGLASADYSGMPGLSFSLLSNEDGSAVGYSLDMDSAGETSNLCAFYAISSGNENSFQFIPSQTLLALCGLDPSNAVVISGSGIVENNFLNEMVSVLVNDTSVCNINITDLDLAQAQEGRVVGTFTVDMEGMNISLTYGYREDGAQTIDYVINGELFYSVESYNGPTEDVSLEPMDYDNAVAVTNLSELLDYVQTADPQVLMDNLAAAGVPLDSADSTVSA